MVLENITQLTIYEAPNLQELFLQELKKQNDVSLDMGNIQKIDLVGIQLLLSLKKSLLLIEKNFTLLNTSSIVLEQIKANYTADALGV